MSQYLSDFAIIRPEDEFAQEETFRRIIPDHVAIDAKKYMCSPKHIGFRSAFCFFSPSELATFDMGQRVELYQDKVEKLFDEFYEEAQVPEELIHVTCTGYHSPSAAQLAMAKRGGRTEVTHAYHMGCLAAVPAIKMGRGFVTSGKEHVDIVHTELCWLHYNPTIETPEQYVALGLFADGAIKYSIRPKGPGLKIHSILEWTIPDTGEQMSWVTKSWGLKMTLSKKIPFSIASRIADFIEELTQGHEIKDAVYSIHPGGPRIIESIAKKLKLNDEQTKISREILYKCGNMSSATTPHMWEKMNREYPPGTKIVHMAFGPGLTLCGMLLEKE